MTKPKTRPLIALATTVILLSVAAAPLAAASGAEETTLTGCVEKTDDGVVLATKDGEKIALTGSDAVANHAGHTVRVTGEWQEMEGKKSFKVSKVEHLAASCEG